MSYEIKPMTFRELLAATIEALVTVEIAIEHGAGETREAALKADAIAKVDELCGRLNKLDEELDSFTVGTDLVVVHAVRSILDGGA